MIPGALFSDLLSHAQARLLHTRQHLDQFEAALTATFLPPQYWSRRVCRVLNFFELRYGRAQRDFHRVLSAMASPSKSAAKSESSQQQAPALELPPRPRYARRHHQSAEIQVVNGAAVTRIVDYSNQHWVDQPPFPENSIFCRQLSFVSGIVPDPYAQILRRHNIALQPPPRGLFVFYSQDEFIQLCRQEIESGASHFTEGNPYAVEPLI